MKIAEYKKGKKITIDNYTYILSADYGDVYSNIKNFNPYFTPQEMLELGIFEGKYINDRYMEFPEEWYIKAKISGLGKESKPNIKLNRFGQKSRQSLRDWKNNGWIYGDDKRGWFEWYCRYFIGRRDPDIDKIQMTRWRQFNRHFAQVKKNCVGDTNFTCRPKQRQALLQWSYNCFI